MSSETKRIVILTGAGISAESGLQTFRDSNGLWEQHRVEDVATPEAYARDPLLVWKFYSMRRIQAALAKPNDAHLSLVKLDGKGRPAAYATSWSAVLRASPIIGSSSTRSTRIRGRIQRRSQRAVARP